MKNSRICTFEDIQTPYDVWTKLLDLHPIDENLVFYEPFRGIGNLYEQVVNNTKYWSEIVDGKDVFDFDKIDEVEVIYTNPPFKADIYGKYVNAVYFFLRYFAQNYTNLKQIGFLINANSYNALTPKRFSELADLNFHLSAQTVFNTNYWYGTYYFLVFKKSETPLLVKFDWIRKTFKREEEEEEVIAT